MDAATLKQRYQKFEQQKHVLIRPETYVGSVKPVTEKREVYDVEHGRVVTRKITHVPALLKIVDEILVNASDRVHEGAGTTTIKVNIDADTGTLDIWNNGTGIPVQKHPVHKVYIPELVFGFLNSGSNFDDTRQRKAGGRNGLGATLALIFCREATVETSHRESGYRFKQTYYDNLERRSPASVRKSTLKNDFTKVTLKPDFKRFNLTGFTPDMVALLQKRVFDLAGCLAHYRVNVYLNGSKLNINSFRQYVTKYYPAGNEPTTVPYLEVKDDKGVPCWEVIVLPSDRGEMEQVSFVNAIHTFRGGRHVKHVLTAVQKPLLAKAKQRYKKMVIKAAHVRNHLKLYINALINNPEFNSQTKEELVTLTGSFGSRFTVTDTFIKAIVRTGVLDTIGLTAREKAMKELNKTSGSKRNRVVVPKLSDANKAGSAKQSRECTLIVTEGDSAKALAMEGRSNVVRGADFYGVFPLRGKLLNVRDASPKKLENNAEVQALVKILGLRFGQTHATVAQLRYGHLMIMADQDVDGFHIKGLILNFIQHFWPSLAAVDGFLQEFITPVVRCRRKSRRASNPIDFYNEPSYREWYREQDDAGTLSQWHIKYYKGLGTSSNAEAREYFSKLDQHVNTFLLPNTTDTHAKMTLAFDKKKANARKAWLKGFDPEKTYARPNDRRVTVSHFIDRELRLFSFDDNERSLPNVMDGLKVSQRKILYACFKRNLTSEVRVAQLSGYVTENTAYHHGEASIQNAIVGMAQTFPFSQNVNVLTPEGQFGSRTEGGKDASAARYISTRLSPMARALFHPQDDVLLSRRMVDSERVEPMYYMPVLPLLLLNGCTGIGSGFSCTFPSFNPLDVLANVRRMLDGNSPTSMSPWYRGFYGDIRESKNKSNTFTCEGRFEWHPKGVLVTELPQYTWPGPYKRKLETYTPANEAKNPKKKPFPFYVDEVAEQDTSRGTNGVRLLIKSKQLASSLRNTSNEDMKAMLKLTSSISLNNMHAHDADNRLVRFESPQEILAYFVPRRLKLYGKRRAYMLQTMDVEMCRLRNMYRFLEEICNNTIAFQKRKKADLIQDLASRHYDKLGSPVASYEYLLRLPFYHATEEKMGKLKAKMEAAEIERRTLAKKSASDLWREDLNAFEKTWIAHVDALNKAENKGESNMGGQKKRKRLSKAPDRKRSRKTKRT